MQEVQIQALVGELRPACREMWPQKIHTTFGVSGWVRGSPFHYFLCGLVLLSRLPRPVMLGEKRKGCWDAPTPWSCSWGPHLGQCSCCLASTCFTFLACLGYSVLQCRVTPPVPRHRERNIWSGQKATTELPSRKESLTLTGAKCDIYGHSEPLEVWEISLDQFLGWCSLCEP